MGLVGDHIEYSDWNGKSAGYTVVEGETGRDLVISDDHVQQTHKDTRLSGRGILKKSTVDPVMHQVTIVPHNSVTVE